MEFFNFQAKLMKEEKDKRSVGQHFTLTGLVILWLCRRWFSSLSLLLVFPDTISFSNTDSS